MEIERRQQDRGIDRAGLKRGCARRGRARKHHVEFAGLDAVRRQHPLDKMRVMSFGPPTEMALPLSSFSFLMLDLASSAYGGACTSKRTMASAARWSMARIGSTRPVDMVMSSEPAASCCTRFALDCT